MVQEKVTSISTTLAPEKSAGDHPFLWEVVDGIVSPNSDGGLIDSRLGGSTPRLGGSTRTGDTIRGTSTASVDVSGGGSSSTITLPANQIYVDLYPDRDNITVFSTSGTLSNPQSFEVQKKEIVVFSNTDRVGLRYGDISNESITLIGKFLDVNGNVVNPSFNISGGSFEIISSVVGYGAVEVIYTTTKKRYLFEFVGSCPATIPLDEEGNEQAVFEQATLLALWQVDNNTLLDATLDVTNPNSRCGTTTANNVSFKQEDPPGLFLEVVDTQRDDSSLASFNPVVTTLRLYPAGAVTASSDILVNSLDIVDLRGGDEIPVTGEMVQFQNTSRQKMKYPIIDGSALNPAPVTEVVDQFGNSVFSPKFVGPGTKIEEVIWTSSVTYKSTGNTFTVPIGEIVSVNSFNKTLPITGVCKMSYTAKYDTILVRRPLNNINGELISPEGIVSTKAVILGRAVSNSIILPEFNAGNNGVES
jgi:hypothetical protein